MQKVGEPAPVDDLMDGVSLYRSEKLVRIRFAAPHRALSCAVYNGGLVEANDYINLRVPLEPSGNLADPADTLADVASDIGCRGLTVGMMTAASTRSLRVESVVVDAVQLSVAVTTGLHNARRAGDPAEYRELHEPVSCPGTINTAIITSAALEPQAMVEIMTVAVEAKAAVLQELGITSPVSGGLATGTGTDAIAVFAPTTGRPVRFGGKHTLLGERVATSHMTALRRSLAWQAEPSR